MRKNISKLPYHFLAIVLSILIILGLTIIPSRIYKNRIRDYINQIEAENFDNAYEISKKIRTNNYQKEKFYADKRLIQTDNQLFLVRKDINYSDPLIFIEVYNSLCENGFSILSKKILTDNLQYFNNIENLDDTGDEILLLLHVNLFLREVDTLRVGMVEIRDYIEKNFETGISLAWKEIKNEQINLLLDSIKSNEQYIIDRLIFSKDSSGLDFFKFVIIRLEWENTLKYYEQNINPEFLWTRHIPKNIGSQGNKFLIQSAPDYIKESFPKEHLACNLTELRYLVNIGEVKKKFIEKNNNYINIETNLPTNVDIYKTFLEVELTNLKNNQGVIRKKFWGDYPFLPQRTYEKTIVGDPPDEEVIIRWLKNVK